MTCGICNPRGSREAWRSSHWLKEKGARIRGYAASADPASLAEQTQSLYYHGAEHVFTDVSETDPLERKGFSTKYHPIKLRSGDTLLLAAEGAFGCNPEKAERIEGEIGERGVAVWQVECNDKFCGV